MSRPREITQPRDGNDHRQQRCLECAAEHPNLSVLTDRNCLITFAAMALCCDNAVRDHEMGYHQGGGTAYITAKGVMRRTGLSRTAAEHALRRLETAGVAGP